MTKIDSYEELTANLKGTDKAYLLLHKSGSESSDCALSQVNEAGSLVKDIKVFSADVKTVRDIHPVYQIASVPSLLEFENGEFKNVIKGCNSVEHYKALFEDAFFSALSTTEDKPQKRVTLYSTPTCTWCNTIKTYFRQHKIRFNDIDVSKDQQAAEEMVRRSGQQGVPQTDINGEIIVGFNKPRINELLNIKG